MKEGKEAINIVCFLERIFKPFMPDENLFLEIRPLPSNEVKKKLKEIRHRGQALNGLRFLFPLTEEGIRDAVAFALEAHKNGYHAYFGVLPRTGDGEVYASEIYTLFQDIDFHDEEKDPIELKNRVKSVNEKYGIVPSLVVDTGGGYHVYFLLAEPIDRETWKGAQSVLRNTLKADEKVAKDLKRILRLPYTVNWKYGVKAELITEGDEVVPKDVVVSIAEKYRGGAQEEVVLDRGLKKEDEERIIQAIKPFYIRGYRHNIINYLTAYLYKNGITEESACSLVEKIAEELNDEEKEARSSFVSWFYNKEKDPSNVKGYSGLEEIFEQIKEEYGVEADPLEALSVLQEVIGKKTVGKDSLLVYTKFHKAASGYVNSKRKRGIYSFVKEDGKIKLTKEIIRACIDDVKIVRNPCTSTTQFVVTFRTKTGRPLEIQGSYREILARLEAEALIVNKGADVALASILSIAEETGSAQVVEDLDVQGFFLNRDGKIVANWEFPEKDTEKIIDALTVLDELISRWFEKDPKAVATIKWGLLSPFFFVRKQMELSPWKWIFLLGTGGTGKSTLLQIIAYIFGVPLAMMEISAGSISTEARLGRKLSQWTFPFIVNEAKGLFTGNEDVRELIKNAWDRITFRGKYKEGQFVEELALAPLAFTSNEHIDFTQAELRRWDVFLFSWKNRVSEEKRIEFENWKKRLKSLSALGREIYEIMAEEKEEILVAETYLQAGETLLERLYTKAGLDVPNWVRLSPSEEDYFGTERDYQSEVRDGIVTLLKAYVVSKLKEFTGHTDVHIPSFPEGQRWRSELKWRLKYLQEKKIPLDVLLFEGDMTDEVIIKKGFLDYLKKNGVKVGTLKEVAELLGGVYGVMHIRPLGINNLKVVRVPLSLIEPAEEPEITVEEGGMDGEELPF